MIFILKTIGQFRYRYQDFKPWFAAPGLLVQNFIHLSSLSCRKHVYAHPSVIPSKDWSCVISVFLNRWHRTTHFIPSWRSIWPKLASKQLTTDGMNPICWEWLILMIQFPTLLVSLMFKRSLPLALIRTSSQFLWYAPSFFLFMRWRTSYIHLQNNALLTIILTFDVLYS